jgi:hypothetical protein
LQRHEIDVPFVPFPFHRRAISKRIYRFIAQSLIDVSFDTMISRHAARKDNARDASVGESFARVPIAVRNNESRPKGGKLARCKVDCLVECRLVENVT